MSCALLQTIFSSHVCKMKVAPCLASLLLAFILALPALAQPATGVYAIQGAKIYTLAGAPSRAAH